MAIKCPKCHSENPETKQYCADCGTPLPQPQSHPPVMTETLQTPVRDLTTGSTFAGRYQVIEELGKGGMGKVYKVFDTKIKEKVALKLIRPEIASDKDTIERFSNELRLARRIRHKNVCGMFDIGEAEGAHFITMEYVPGEDLKSMIRMAAGLSIGAVLSIGKHVCDGLAEAHSLGVVHRDLKPHNVMIDKGGNAKVMDFGIARSIREKGITGPSVLIGTPEYMSPEQAEAKEVDQRSDIYSLGIILYEMATGRVPFEGETALSIAMKHKGETPKNPKQFNPNIPDDLGDVILKCLEKDKAKRYQTATDVRSELEKIEKGIPTTERVVTERKPLTSKEITVKFKVKKLLIPGVILAGLIIIGVIMIWRGRSPQATAPPGSANRSIAVLPFADLSPAKDREYLCDGITETLINALTNIEGLWVPARTSTFYFKDKELDVHDIGRKLNVENVLEGSVQVAGDNLRVTARISNVQDGRQVWSDIFNREMEDMFAIQDDIAKAIVKGLKVKLLGENEIPLVKKYTENLQAYNLYLQGRYFWNKRTANDIKKAIGFFTQAIELDPHYALAYVGLADGYMNLPEYARTPTRESISKARVAVSKALEIDDLIAEAHTSLGLILENEWNWKESEKEYRRAIELNPNYATGHHWYGDLLVVMGRLDEALEELKRALQLDPLSLIINTALGTVFSYRREYDQAIQQYHKVLELDPNFSQASLQLGQCYQRKGLLKEAITEYQEVRNLIGDIPDVLGKLGYAYASSGEKAKAIEVLTSLMSLAKQGISLNYDIAFIYYGFGDKEKAFEWLEKAYQAKEGAMGLGYIKAMPEWDRLRSDPRFKSLLKRMNLE